MTELHSPAACRSAGSLTPGERRPPGLLAELKLLFAALGAGSAVVPMGDNGRTTRMLAEYAACLRGH